MKKFLLAIIVCFMSLNSLEINDQSKVKIISRLLENNNFDDTFSFYFISNLEMPNKLFLSPDLDFYEVDFYNNDKDALQKYVNKEVNGAYIDDMLNRVPETIKRFHIAEKEIPNFDLNFLIMYALYEKDVKNTENIIRNIKELEDDKELTKNLSIKTKVLPALYAYYFSLKNNSIITRHLLFTDIEEVHRTDEYMEYIDTIREAYNKKFGQDMFDRDVSLLKLRRFNAYESLKNN